MIRSSAKLVFIAGSYWRLSLIATDLVPVNRSAHGGYEYFGYVGLVREGEAEGVLGKCWGFLSDVADQSARVGVFFAADGRVGKLNYR